MLAMVDEDQIHNSDYKSHHTTQDRFKGITWHFSLHPPSPFRGLLCTLQVRGLARCYLRTRVGGEKTRKVCMLSHLPFEPSRKLKNPLLGQRPNWSRWRSGSLLSITFHKYLRDSKTSAGLWRSWCLNSHCADTQELNKGIFHLEKGEIPIFLGCEPSSFFSRLYFKWFNIKCFGIKLAAMKKSEYFL